MNYLNKHGPPSIITMLKFYFKNTIDQTGAGRITKREWSALAATGCIEDCGHPLLLQTG